MGSCHFSAWFRSFWSSAIAAAIAGTMAGTIFWHPCKKNPLESHRLMLHVEYSCLLSHSFFLQAIFGSPSDSVTVLRRCSAGVGYPQLSAVLECADAAHGTLATFRQDQTLGKLFLMSHWDHLVNIQTNYGKSPILMSKSMISMAIFSIAM